MSPDDFCPECGGELAIPEHGAGCGWVAERLADRAWDRWEDDRLRGES